MTAPEAIIQTASTFALIVLGVAFILTVFRVVVGPTLPDRVLALDMLVGIVLGFIAAFAIRTGYTLYIDIAISLGLVGFLTTVAFARFILTRGLVGEEASAARPKGREKAAGAKAGKEKPGQEKPAVKAKAGKGAAGKGAKS